VLDYASVKIFLGIFASVLAVAAILPYLASLLRGSTKPHLFSWIIWFLISIIASAAQYAGGAGPGMWVTLTSALASLFVACMALRLRHEVKIHRSDKVAFLLALAGIPVWMVTDEPVTATIIVTFVNVMAFLPTIRKAWEYPQSENALSFVLHSSKWIAGLMALSSLTPATVLYPAVIACANGLTAAVILFRR
jgi:hypothetical protein